SIRPAAANAARSAALATWCRTVATCPNSHRPPATARSATTATAPHTVANPSSVPLRVIAVAHLALGAWFADCVRIGRHVDAGGKPAEGRCPNGDRDTGAVLVDGEDGTVRSEAPDALVGARLVTAPEQAGGLPGRISAAKLVQH